MFTQVDSYDHHYKLLQDITNHMKNLLTIPISDGMIRLHNGNMIPKKTTEVWYLLVEWKDGSSIWITLKDLKTSNPGEFTEYAAGNRLDVYPAF